MRLLLVTSWGINKHKHFINEDNKYFGYNIKYYFDMSIMYKGYWFNNMELGKWFEWEIYKYYL